MLIILFKMMVENSECAKNLLEETVKEVDEKYKIMLPPWVASKSAILNARAAVDIAELQMISEGLRSPSTFKDIRSKNMTLAKDLKEMIRKAILQVQEAKSACDP